MKSAYVTFDRFDYNNGAGKVCVHEMNALRTVTNSIARVTRDEIAGADKYDFNPFLYDYFASFLVPEGLDLLHLSCSPGMAILAKAKPKHYVVNIVAHDLETSITEHELYNGKGTYPFKHNTDPYLHMRLLQHANNADMIFTPSYASARWIKANIDSEVKVKVIPHGVDIPDHFAPLPSDFSVGYLGAFGPDKGLIYLYNACIGTTTLILGGTCCNVAPKLFHQARCLGWLNDVADFYNQISVYIQPSVTEGFGIEILEAMSYGRPVIVSSGAGGADVVSNGIDGFVVQPRDVSGIFDKIKFLKEYPNALREMGLRAREKSKKYQWDKIEKMYMDVYQEILGGQDDSHRDCGQDV